MGLFVVAIIVLAVVGIMLWKAVAAQAMAAGRGPSDDDAPTGPTRSPGGTRPRRPRAVAPDDDPEFLRRLDDQLRRPGRDDPPSA